MSVICDDPVRQGSFSAGRDTVRAGEPHSLLRSVDHEREVLEAYVTKKRDKAAALKFLIKVMKRDGNPEVVVTDKCRQFWSLTQNSRGPKNQSRSMVFLNPSNGRYAVGEAKSSLKVVTDRSTGNYQLLLLPKDRGTLRQGTRDWIESRLQRYIDRGDGRHSDLAATLIGELRAGTLRSLVTSRNLGKTFEVMMGPGNRALATEVPI